MYPNHRLMDFSATVFSPTGTVQTYLVPATGGYLIEAAGAQVPSPAGGGLRGDRVKGMFYLNRGDILKVVVGSQQPPSAQLQRLSCAGEGGSIVWRGAGELPLPAKRLLAAGGGQRERPLNPGDPHWGDSFNAGAFQANSPAVQPGDGYVSIRPLIEASDSRPGASVPSARESSGEGCLPPLHRAHQLS